MGNNNMTIENLTDINVPFTKKPIFLDEGDIIQKSKKSYIKSRLKYWIKQAETWRVLADDANKKQRAILRRFQYKSEAIALGYQMLIDGRARYLPERKVEWYDEPQV